MSAPFTLANSTQVKPQKPKGLPFQHVHHLGFLPVQLDAKQRELFLKPLQSPFGPAPFGVVSADGDDHIIGEPMIVDRLVVPFRRFAANRIEVDWFFDAIRRKTAEGDYEAINYHRFADDVVITVSGHHTKRGWAERALQRLQEQFALLGVELNREKTKVVDMLKGEAFGFLGFDLRRVRKRKGGGHLIL